MPQAQQPKHSAARQTAKAMYRFHGAYAEVIPNPANLLPILKKQSKAVTQDTVAPASKLLQSRKNRKGDELIMAVYANPADDAQVANMTTCVMSLTAP